MVTILVFVLVTTTSLKHFGIQLLNSQRLSIVQKLIKAFTLSIDVYSKTNEQ